MKKYTHAWIALMAMKRLEKIVVTKDNETKDRLVKWFKNNRDYVIKGSWYPDLVIKDMATSHIIKYSPNGDSNKTWTLPNEYHLLEIGKSCELFSKPYSIEKGNLPDRCEAFTHSIIDNLKILEREDKGSPISPTNNHIATMFFMLSHYIADAHMPLHCDCRPFSDGDGIHAKIEEEWEVMIKNCFDIDLDNEVFRYDPLGYPLAIEGKTDPVIKWVEDNIISRPFSSDYGPNNNNTWDFMSAITYYSYLTAYKMIPQCYSKDIKWNEFIVLKTDYTFNEYSQYILLDAIDSISRVWFRIWGKYLTWLK